MLLKPVFLEHGGLDKGLLAHFTLIRLDPVYSQPVTPERLRTCKPFQTMPALVRLFAGVGHRVGLEVRGLKKSQAAFFTFVRPYTVVRADVRVEVGRLREGLLAELAREGFESRVNAGMESQFHRCVELGLAGRALETLDRTVGHFVAGTLAAVAEHCRTKWAFEGLFLGVGAHVRPHVVFVGERLETDVALERLDPRVNPHV